MNIFCLRSDLFQVDFYRGVDRRVHKDLHIGSFTKRNFQILRAKCMTDSKD